MRDDKGKAYRMIGSMVDMTPVYDVQKKIVESENRLRTILDTDPECINLLDEDANLLDINKAGLEMIEANGIEQVLGSSILQVVAEAQRVPAGELVRNAFKGESGRLEFEMITLKGTKRWCEVNIVPFRDADDHVVSVLAVTRDMTKRKIAETELAKNEEKYRTLVEQAADAIALYDAAGKVLDVNTGAVKLLGYSKKELVGMYLKDILTPEEISSNPVHYDILQLGKSTVKQRKMFRKDGTVVDTEVRSQQLPDGRFLSVIRDLTERIKAEQDLQQSYKALQELTGYLQNIREEERLNIAREIHDELGQQLTVLKMDISWLNKKIQVPDEKVKERLSDLLGMVDNTVKTVRRISSELRPSMLDDLGLPAAIEWQALEFEKRSGLKIRTDISMTDLKLPAKAAITLFRVFQESLTNVARHAEATQVNVKLQAEAGRLYLSIRDDGKGFLPQNIENKKTLGILGMKERVQIIQGDYTISSVPGKGTTVQVSVPLENQP
jgi:PAS domain S-box-containing protein